MITPLLLVKAYNCKLAMAQLWAPYMDSAAKLCDADADPYRLACFLGQVGHESGRLRYTREIWGPTSQQLRYEPDTPLSKQLGNFRAGDGKRYMGRGLIQVTGRLNYHATFGKMKLAMNSGGSTTQLADTIPDFENEPEALERPLWAALSAGLYWKSRNLNKYADARDFVTLTRRINGGINGLADRQAIFASAYAALVQ